MGYFLKNRQFQSGSSGMVIPTGSIFQSVAVSGGINYTVDTFTGTGSQTVFTMSEAVSSADQIIVFVGNLYQLPVSNYTVNGSNDITFTSPPPDGVPINVIHSNS